eukprot:gene6348-2974_t
MDPETAGMDPETVHRRSSANFRRSLFSQRQGSMDSMGAKSLSSGLLYLYKAESFLRRMVSSRSPKGVDAAKFPVEH